MTRERFDAAVRRLEPLYDEVGVAAPAYPERFSARFEDQAEAVLEARPAAFSFVFGVPDERVLAAFRDAGIVTLGTATTPDEAVALDEAGIDIIVASGAEAGGHRGAFLAPAEDSLVGTLPLVRIAVEEVQAPVIAAGGIADARGIVAALALGAEGVQIGTAFLATDESGATAEHKAELLGAAHGTRRSPAPSAAASRAASPTSSSNGSPRPGRSSPTPTRATCSARSWRPRARRGAPTSSRCGPARPRRCSSTAAPPRSTPP